MGQLTTEGVQWSSPDGKVLVVGKTSVTLDEREKYTRRIIVQDEDECKEAQVIQATEENYLEKIDDAILWAEGYHRGKYIEEEDK